MEKDAAVNIEESILMKLSVKDLKEELQIRQQVVTGKKAILQERLKHSLSIPVISALVGGKKGSNVAAKKKD